MRKGISAFHLWIMSFVSNKTLLDKLKLHDNVILGMLLLEKKSSPHACAPHSMFLTRSRARWARKAFPSLTERGCGLDWNCGESAQDHNTVLFHVSLVHRMPSALLRTVLQDGLYICFFLLTLPDLLPVVCRSPNNPQCDYIWTWGL